MNPRYLFPVLLCLMLISPAFSAPLTAESVSSYAFTATPGSVIYKIVINDLPFGTNQSHVLSYKGQTYLITIGTYTEWGIWRNADISMTLPNGSVQTVHTSASTIAGSYKTTIQPVIRADSSQLTGGTISFITVDLMIGVNPVGAQFGTQPINFNPSGAIPFEAASGNLGGTTTVYVYQVTEKEFQETIEVYNPTAGLGDLGSTIFQWAWDSVLGFLNMIPVIGPIMVSLIETMGGIISVGFFWLSFVVMNFPAVLCGVETLILMMSVINAGTGKNSFGKLGKNIYQYNLAFVMGCIGLTNIVWGWTKSAVDMVGTIVQALKPI